MSAAEDLARCDREIERIHQEKVNAKPSDMRGILQGLFDWEVEKTLIARAPLPNGSDKPEFKQKGNPNG
jgi:hypothetical protein